MGAGACSAVASESGAAVALRCATRDQIIHLARQKVRCGHCGVVNYRSNNRTGRDLVTRKLATDTQVFQPGSTNSVHKSCTI